MEKQSKATKEKDPAKGHNKQAVCDSKPIKEDAAGSRPEGGSKFWRWDKKELKERAKAGLKEKELTQNEPIPINYDKVRWPGF